MVRNKSHNMTQEEEKKRRAKELDKLLEEIFEANERIKRILNAS